MSSSAAARGQLAGAVVISNEAIPQIGIYKSRHLASDTMLVAGLRCDGTSRMINLIERSDLFELSAYHARRRRRQIKPFINRERLRYHLPKGCEGRVRSGDRIVSMAEKTVRPILC